jgi:predicted esterase
MPERDSLRAAHPHIHHIRVQRTARFYTLGADDGNAASVWFLLHGYGQLAEQFIRYFADLANDQTLLVAPEAMNRFYLVNPTKAPAAERPVGATWMTREDRESEVGDYVEYLDLLFDEIRPRVEAGAVVNVLGFSQGAATATRWVSHGRVRASRLILWGGLLPPDSDVAKGHSVLRHVPLTIVLGTRDHYVNEEMLFAELARLDAAGIPKEIIRFDGGHAVSRSVFPQLTRRSN